VEDAFLFSPMMNVISQIPIIRLKTIVKKGITLS
jgi:hypothetical protein